MNNTPNRQKLQRGQLYFVADIGANHDGDFDRACKLIELAKEAGAHAAKFQNFKANKIVSDGGFNSLGETGPHQKAWKKSVVETYADASVSDEWSPRLRDKCDEFGIDYFTSPYDFDSVDHADKFVDLFKIGSGDITWLEMIRYIGNKGKPVLMATGAASMTDVYRAMATLSDVNDEICLMQCNTNYVADNDKIQYTNLSVLTTFGNAFPNALLGLSDHSFGHATVCGGVALGARVIEKHFTDDNSRLGPDHRFAMNPVTWKLMVDTANDVLAALGDGVKRVEKNELDSRVVQQRGLYTTRKIRAGTNVRPEHIEALRPCPDGAVRPYELEQILGNPAPRNIDADTVLMRADFLTVNTTKQGTQK